MWQADIWKGPLSWESAATSKPAAAVGDKGGWILSQSIPAIHHVWDLQTGFYSRGFWWSPQSPAVGLPIAAMGPVQRLGLPWWQGGTVDGMGGGAGPWRGSCHQNLQLSSDHAKASWVMSERRKRWGKHLQGVESNGHCPRGEVGWAVTHLTDVREPYRTAMEDKKGFGMGYTGESRSVDFMVVSLVASELNGYRGLQGELARMGNVSWVGLSPDFGTTIPHPQLAEPAQSLIQICDSHNKWSCLVCFALST